MVNKIEGLRGGEETNLAQVASNAVGQNNDNNIVLGQVEISASLDTSGHGTTTASSNQETLLSDKFSRVLETCTIISLEPVVDT
jgi:hypothetical protein